MIIYGVENLVNNKWYVGLTTHILEERKQQHLYDIKSKSNCPYFHNAIKKYGIDNFKWEILKDNIDSEDELKKEEIFYISYFDSYENGYNLTIGGDGVFGFKHSEESRKKISESNKGIEPWNKGKTNIYSEETKKKIGFAKIGNKNAVGNKSEEHRRKISETMKGRKLSEEHRRKISETMKGKTP